MKEEQYGESYKEHLLQQYKLYTEMADQVSRRRIQANQFYISLLSGLLAFLSFIVSQQSFNNARDMMMVSISCIGVFLCLVWYINIRSYKQLNKLKFKVIHEMESMLPFACYVKEWELEKEKQYRYIRLTRVENYIAIVMAFPYIFLLFYAISNLK